jgi:hypothetical protein
MPLDDLLATMADENDNDRNKDSNSLGNSHCCRPDREFGTCCWFEDMAKDQALRVPAPELAASEG